MALCQKAINRVKQKLYEFLLSKLRLATILIFMVELVRHPRATTIVLRPNRSATWRQNKILLLCLAVFVVIIAVSWAIAGAWVVLPFAGLEVSLLAFLMYRVSYNTYQKQVITINSNIITIEQGVYKAETQVTLPTEETHLSVKEAETEFDITKLALTVKNKSVAIGQFLNQKDTREAQTKLQQAGLTVCSDKWWKY